MCVSAIGGKFRTGIQFFLLYRNEVSYKEKKTTILPIEVTFFNCFPGGFMIYSEYYIKWEDIK